MNNTPFVASEVVYDEIEELTVYGAGDQKPSEIKMKKNQVYGLGQRE